MKLNSYVLAVLIFVLLFGGVSFTSAMNWWQTESQKEPVRYSEGEAAGEYNPADIRGSYTFGEVSQLFAVPLEDLQAAFQLPVEADPAAYQLKSLETAYPDIDVEIGTGSVRMFVALYRGLPFALDAVEETYLLPDAVAILERQDNLTEEQRAYLAQHTAGASLPVEEAPNGENPAPPAATEHAPEEYTVTGKTTFQNLLDWGMTKETIESLIGEEIPAPQILVKDYASSRGITFSELKSKLQAEVDRTR